MWQGMVRRKLIWFAKKTASFQSGDYCNLIAGKFDLTLQELEQLNAKTWGWNGCNKLYPDAKLCVSDGEPPFPAAQANAVCGPTKVGTSKPPGSKSTDWALLNECPLKACCNVWGNCGTTDDFCINRSTGPPGTSSGANGCIANCGIAVTNNRKPPKQFQSVGYFESWNKNRKCLHMDINDIPSNKYTHIHFAFADISPSYQVGLGSAQEDFNKFRQARGYKRILAFGGWAFSTERATYAIFRDGVRSNNRERLATSLANFIIQNDLDGVDFDWEYPSVPDMDWLPRSSPDEGPNYAAFLELMRSKLPQKSISFAAPASYWYLKAFPIERMAKVVDYIVYMTYDLHGQWDFGNKWSMTGCSGGNCLRSHVDFMETYNALAMITKAGAPAEKVMVGISSYGRQFKMTDPSCTHSNCTFVGPESKATPGRCTEVPDYISNAEIAEIIQKNPSAKVMPTDGFAKVMTYDGNWVSYMDDKDKTGRANLWKGLNFGGVVEWAIDLNSFEHDGKSSGGQNPNAQTGMNGPKNPYSVAKGSGMRRGGGGVAFQPATADLCENDDSWRKVTCAGARLGSSSLDASEKWSNAKADGAWCQAVQFWNGIPNKEARDLNFSSIVSEALDGPLQWNCDVVTSGGTGIGTGCVAPAACQGGVGEAAAAMQPILISLHNINNFFVDIHNGINGAMTADESAKTKLKELFIKKKDKSLEIFFNILTMAIGLGTSSMFGAFLKTGSKLAASAKVQDFNKDFWAAGVDAGKALNKDIAETKFKSLEAKVIYLLEKTVGDWKSHLKDMNRATFKGDQGSIDMLTKLMKNGAAYNRKAKNALDFETNAKRFLYGVMIPDTWRMQGLYPVLLDTAFPCKTPGIGVRQWTPHKNVPDQMICRQDQDRQYQLWGVEGTMECHSTGPCNGIQTCNNQLRELPGAKEMRKIQPEFGNLTIFHMTDSVFKGYEMWNGNHKYGDEDLVSDTVLSKFGDYLNPDNPDISTLPGVYNIPICTWLTIKENWVKGPPKGDPGNYPCN